jgi:hypothetical protein
MSPPAQAEPDLADRLRAIPGMTVQEKPSTIPGVRWFWLTYRQPVDHHHPERGSFAQRVVLQHRSLDRPMVFHTTGHFVPETMFQTEPTTLLDANQLSMEYRYYPPSRPDPVDWTKDTLWQGAADQHALIVALRGIYGRKWITTGGSKGGQAAVIHRRYYPNDVAGTVAYVAPNDVDDDEDSAYDRFFATVGSEPCRTHVEALAREILERRPAMEQLLASDAAAKGWTFDLVGGLDVAFELSVMDYEWGFWSYNGESACAGLPPLDASDEVLYDSFTPVLGFPFFTDQALSPFAQTFYQGGTEMGWWRPSFPHLQPLLRHQDAYQPRTFVPRNIPMSYDSTVIRDVDHWVRYHGSRLMFVNGGNDPVSAEPYRLGPGTRDSAVYTAPGVKHVFLGEVIAQLPAPQRDKATADLRRWAS